MAAAAVRLGYPNGSTTFVTPAHVPRSSASLSSFILPPSSLRASRRDADAAGEVGAHGGARRAALAAGVEPEGGQPDLGAAGDGGREVDVEGRAGGRALEHPRRDVGRR